MTPGAEKITQAALTLSQRERALLASTLLDSLDGADVDRDEVEEAWTPEIDRRIDDLLSGRVETVPWETVKAKLEADRAARRR